MRNIGLGLNTFLQTDLPKHEGDLATKSSLAYFPYHPFCVRNFSVSFLAASPDFVTIH